MEKALLLITLTQTVTVLNDAFGLTGMQPQQAQMGFENIQEPRWANRNFSKRCPWLRTALTIEVKSETDSHGCLLIF